MNSINPVSACKCQNAELHHALEKAYKKAETSKQAGVYHNGQRFVVVSDSDMGKPLTRAIGRKQPNLTVIQRLNVQA